MIVECGCDEAGRGSGIGEIFAGAVILDPLNPIEGLRDSKKLSANKRDFLTLLIKQRALAWSIAVATLEEIEELNVHHASLLAMKRAIEGLTMNPDRVYIDGMHVPVLQFPVEAIIRGDDKIPGISAASIIAKVTRDKAMVAYHQVYPEYGFDKHKGYLTPQHLAALAKYGPCPIHRKTYGPIAALLEASK
jgi:ribonuclease HII